MSRSIEARRRKREEDLGLRHIARQIGLNENGGKSPLGRQEVGRVLFTIDGGEVIGGRIVFGDLDGNDEAAVVRRMTKAERDRYNR